MCFLPCRQLYTDRRIAAHLHVSLIVSPFRKLRATLLPAQPLFDLRRRLLNREIDGGVIHRHAALNHHLPEIAIADAKASVP